MQANLNVRYAEENAKKGPLSSVRPLHIEVGEFIDKRPETDKIGYKRGGFGEKTGKIVTTKPVPQIVREAILLEFLKNGHLIGKTDKDIILSGTITSFWFDLQYVTGIGTISVNLNIIDGKTGATLLTRTYNGNYIGLPGPWDHGIMNVMNVALERMVQQMGADNKLIQVLKSL